jgi:predicted metal-dependent hydrolase
MLRTGENLIDGVRVLVERKRVRRINLTVSRGGEVRLSYPAWGGTLAETEAFLRAKWRWVLETRARLLTAEPAAALPVGDDEISALRPVIAELHGLWCARLGEEAVVWKIRRMKSLWGSCHFRRRVVVYSAALARVPRELVEYVVVHELTHLKAHGHGEDWQRLMDARLPDWRILRRRLR